MVLLLWNDLYFKNLLVRLLNKNFKDLCFFHLGVRGDPEENLVVSTRMNLYDLL